MKTFSEATLIPVSLILIMGAGVWWAASVEARTKTLEKAQIVFEHIAADISTMREDIAVMKNELTRIKR